jgi:hypothetical protein
VMPDTVWRFVPRSRRPESPWSNRKSRNPHFSGNRCAAEPAIRDVFVLSVDLLRSGPAAECSENLEIT